MCVCALIRHTSSLSLSACMCSLCDQCLHLSSCYRTTNLKTGTASEREGRKGKQFRHPLNMRVNHNWFALVTVELADRCRRGVWQGEGRGGPAHWEKGVKRRKKGRNLGCVFSCVYQKSLMRPVSLSCLPCGSSVCSVILVNGHSPSINVSIIHMRADTHTHVHTQPLVHAGYDSNLV